MIVISSSLVLSPPSSDFNADSPVVGYKNRVSSSNIAATSEASGYPATNLANPATFLGWRATSTATQYLTCTLTSNAEDVDYVGIAGHNFGTAGATVSIEANSGSGYVEVVAGIIPVDDRPLMFLFPASNYIGVRAKVLTPSTAPRAAVMYVGKYLQLQRRIYVGHVPMPYGRQRTVVVGRSESGNFMGRVVTGGQVSTSVSLQNLTPSWYRTYMDPFVRNCETLPFFFAWRPSTYPREVGYAWLTNDPMPKNQRQNGMMQVDLQMSGIIA